MNYLFIYRNDNVHIEQRTISAFLIAAYALLRLDWDAEKINNVLLQSMPARLAFFRDYHGDSDYKLNILDCLRGLHIGCKINKWFTSYESTKFPESTNSHLDMNWIVPNQFLAFKDPTANREKDFRSISKSVIKELNRCNIKVIVRLNGNDHTDNIDYYGYSYNASDFKRENFYHYEIPFKDVSVPVTAQANLFVNLCERYGGNIAVHCHAGLGRTATMIGCHLMKNYGFDSRSVCAWLKMCRRGSVMGPQHNFLDQYMKNIENIKKTNGLQEEIVTIRVKKESVASKLIGTSSSPKETRIARPPRKNNIIHIVPVNVRQSQKNPMQKYKFDSQKADCKKSKDMITTQPTSVVKTPVPTSNIERSKTTGKKVSQSVTRSRTRSVSTTIRSNSKMSSDISPRSKKYHRRIVKSAPVRPFCVNLSDINTDVINNSRAKIQAKTSKTRKIPRPMNKRTSKSHETIRPSIRSINPSFISSSNSWSQWGGQIIDGLVSQSKNRICGLVHTVYSRNGLTEKIC